MQRLIILQSLWGMERLKGRPVEMTVEEKVAAVAAAGFDGFSCPFSAPFADRAAVRRVTELRGEYGLAVEAQAFPTDIESLKPALDLAAEFGAHHVTVQGDVRPRAFSESVRILEGWLRLAEACPVPVYFETHRGRITNDLLVTLDLIEAVPNARLTADLSHYVVAREFPPPPVADEMEAQVSTILGRSWAAHGRVAAPGQVQVELSFPQHAPWIAQFAAWWSELFASWRRRAGADETFAFTCELGPQPYAISGPDGEDQTDRWAEAQRLRDFVRRLWSDPAARF